MGRGRAEGRLARICENVVFISVVLVARVSLWRVDTLEWGAPSQLVLATRKEQMRWWLTKPTGHQPMTV